MMQRKRERERENGYLGRNKKGVGNEPREEEKGKERKNGELNERE